MSHKSFKQPAPYLKSGAVGLSSTAIQSSTFDYPIFCFKHLHRDYDFDRCSQADKKFLKGFVQKMKVLSDCDWTTIQLSDKHGVGSEKIAKGSIRPSIPTSITADVKDFLSFYFAGGSGRIIAHRSGHVLHVIYIDTDLTVYSHT